MQTRNKLAEALVSGNGLERVLSRQALSGDGGGRVVK